jgi:hypothetical protein
LLLATTVASNWKACSNGPGIIRMIAVKNADGNGKSG